MQILIGGVSEVQNKVETKNVVSIDNNVLVHSYGDGKTWSGFHSASFTLSFSCLAGALCSSVHISYLWQRRTEFKAGWLALSGDLVPGMLG